MADARARCLLLYSAISLAITQTAVGTLLEFVPRNFSGAGNNIAFPAWGSTGITQMRVLAGADYADDVFTPPGDDRPTAREIMSDVFLSTTATVSTKSALFVAWGQLLTYDLSLTVDNGSEPFNIACDDGGGVVDVWCPLGAASDEIPFSRSSAAVSSSVRSPVNYATAYIDLDYVYGRSKEEADAVRSFEGGFMNVTETGVPFQNADGTWMVLGALQVLGRGNCFADVASFSLMSRSTAEKSFHRFCDCFSAGLWHQWVRLPEGDDLKNVESIYSRLGFPGAVGSTDCTHVAWERCPFSQTNNHKGKEGYTSVAFEVTCDHTGRIIASTKGYPGAENDKTIIKRDLSVRRIRDNDPWASYKYELRDLEGNVTEHTGGWLIVDGGYQRVPLLICPMKVYANDEEDAWSSRLESVRKDIECVFGRIKGRFRIFKTALLFSTREKVDNAWFTACIIHNMLLQFDGLGKLEKDMDWAGKDGMADGKTGRFAPETNPRDNTLPSPADKTFHDFRQQLVDHFTHEKAAGRISWFRVA